MKQKVKIRTMKPASNNNMDYRISNIFPNPMYYTQRGSKLDSTELKGIEDLIAGGLITNVGNSFTKNTYVLDTKLLYKLKEFCDQHIKIYVKEVITPKEKLDFYITQSWLNITPPGGRHQTHTHPNSIISGAFYIQTGPGQTINCYDQHKYKKIITIESETNNPWNCNTCVFNVTDNDLFLFPSWIDHGVEPNKEQTKDVISISFNTFVRGTLGSHEGLTELILK